MRGKGSAASQTNSEQHIAELQEVMEVTGFTAGSSFYRCGNGGDAACPKPHCCSVMETKEVPKAKTLSPEKYA